MTNIAVFAGTFDPFTIGHKEIVGRALPIFDTIIIAIGVNDTKTPIFPLDERVKIIKDSFLTHKKITVETYTGLTGDFCIEKKAKYLLRGVRNALDFQYENDLAQANKEIFNLETVFFISSPTLTHVSSSFVRELIKNKGNYLKYLP
jgi:pantetheine-phosphate adenylyltransferase